MIHRLLENQLTRSGYVSIHLIFQVVLRAAGRRAQSVDIFLREKNIAAGVMLKIRQIHFNPAVGRKSHHFSENVSKNGFAVGCQAHHLVFIAVYMVAQIFRQHSVEKSKRIRIIYAAQIAD